MKWQRLVRLGILLLGLIMILLPVSTIAGQQNMPERVQIYRFIRFTSHERAGDIRWIEIWESHDDSRRARQVVMVDGMGGQQGVEVSCYYALAIGAGVPVYMADGERVPVDTADRLWDIFENKRLVAQSELFATETDCKAEGSENVNGIQTQHCSFENVDASTLFLIRPPATSRGELWTAADGGFPVRYEFEANGSDGDVFHRFEAIAPPDNFVIAPPHDVDLLCFDDGFPVPDTTIPLTGGNLTYAAFESDMNMDELERFYDRSLLPAWSSEGSDEQGARIYKHTLDSGNECQLHLRLTQRADARGTYLAASVYPSYVEAANLPSPQGFEEPVVVQSLTSATITIDGDVETALAEYIPSLEGTGWVMREELTDIREDSAFVTLARDNYEMHITVDGRDGKTVLRLQTRVAVCGSTFTIYP
ncbi:MAG: hypothetical protein JW963_23850 [Anaerolineales bacterium]|nr:hypothetical protein [Anaerolineales bacterium]